MSRMRYSDTVEVFFSSRITRWFNPRDMRSVPSAFAMQGALAPTDDAGKQALRSPVPKHKANSLSVASEPMRPASALAVTCGTSRVAEHAQIAGTVLPYLM